MARLTKKEREEIAEILSRRANEIAATLCAPKPRLRKVDQLWMCFSEAVKPRWPWSNPRTIRRFGVSPEHAYEEWAAALI